jgi:hypothetical protein
MAEHQPTVDGLNPAAVAYTGTELLTKKVCIFAIYHGASSGWI